MNVSESESESEEGEREREREMTVSKPKKAKSVVTAPFSRIASQEGGAWEEKEHASQSERKIQHSFQARSAYNHAAFSESKNNIKLNHLRRKIRKL